MKEAYSYEELKELTQKTPISEIVNKKGILYKERKVELERLSEDDLLREMAKEPKLIRRPLIILENKVIAGFNEEEYSNNFLK